MKKTTALLAAATLALAMSACGTDTEPAKTKTVTQEVKPTKTAEPAAEPEPEPEPAPEDYDDSDAQDVIVEFGETYEWLDGTTAKISEPKPYTPDEYGIGGEGYNEVVAVDVTITNGQSVPLDVSYETPVVSSAGEDGDEVWDDTVGMGSESSLLPGKSVTFKAAYGVNDSGDMVVEFAPTWDHRTAYWTNGE